MAGLLEPEQAATLIERIIRAKASSSMEACAALLSRAVAARPLSARASLTGAAEVLPAALPGDSAHLRTRIAEPLEAPKDWRRNSQLSCSCPDRRDLARFLDNPAQETWILKAAEARRGHVEAMIRQAGSDLDVATDRKGRPYTLVCTKNQASYERRIKQRQRDLKTMARLEV